MHSARGVDAGPALNVEEKNIRPHLAQQTWTALKMRSWPKQLRTKGGNGVDPAKDSLNVSTDVTTYCRSP